MTYGAFVYMDSLLAAEPDYADRLRHDFAQCVRIAEAHAGGYARSLSDLDDNVVWIIDKRL
jgi:hypothetical protein